MQRNRLLLSVFKFPAAPLPPAEGRGEGPYIQIVVGPSGGRSLLKL